MYNGHPYFSLTNSGKKRCALYVAKYGTWFLPQIIRCCWVLTYMEKENKSFTLTFFSSWHFQNCFQKQMTWDRFCQISLHIYSILSIDGSFHLLSLLPSRSLNQQTTLLGPLLESVFLSRPLSTFISLLIFSITWLKHKTAQYHWASTR